MSMPALNLDAAKAVAETAKSLPDQARALTITTHAEFEAAGRFLVQVKQRRQAIDAAFQPAIASAFKAHREICALKKQADGPCEVAEHIAKTTMATYQQQQERLRREAEERAAVERRRAEQAAAAEAERLRQEAAAAAETKRMEAAEAAMDAGDLVKCETILETPVRAPLVAVPPVVVPEPVEAPPAAKAEGVTFRRVAKWRLVDEKLVDRRYLCVDTKKIDAVVRALGEDAADSVGGIEIYFETNVAARGR